MTTKGERLFAIGDDLLDRHLRMMGVRRSDGRASSLHANARGHLQVGEVNSFGRTRVSRGFLIFDNLLHEKQDLADWETILTGTGTFNFSPTDACGVLATTNNGDVVIREQHGYNHFVGGKDLLVFAAGIFGSPETDITKRIGLFNDNDGVFFQSTVANFSIIRRINTVDTPINQAEWNLDILDGSGSSGIALDLTKIQFLIIDTTWFTIRYGFDFGDSVVYVHEEKLLNTEDVFPQTSLPIRYEIRQGGATPGSLKQISSTVQLEADENAPSISTGISTGSVIKSIPGAARQSTLSVRLKQLLDSGVDNRRIAIPFSFSLITNKDILVELIIQHITDGAPVYGGTPTWTDAGSKSGLEYTADITTVTGGHILSASFVQGAGGSSVNRAEIILPILIEPVEYMSRNSDNSDSDYIHLVITNLEAQAADLRASMVLEERF